jgi:predicted peroxiredoxin
MLAVSTVGPENPSVAAEPFVVGQAGPHTEDGDVALFLMGEAAYLASENHVDLGELKAPGFDPIGVLLEELLADDLLREAVVCEPCATAREIDAADLRDWATMGGPADLGRMTDEHDTTVTF